MGVIVEVAIISLATAGVTFYLHVARPRYARRLVEKQRVEDEEVAYWVRLRKEWSLWRPIEK